MMLSFKKYYLFALKEALIKYFTKYEKSFQLTAGDRWNLFSLYKERSQGESKVIF